MMLFSVGYATDIILIVLLLCLLLILLIGRRLIFKVLARINKLLIPTMLHKDLNKLKVSDRVLIAYRYWVTKNSL